ncbi:hypothetical protein QYF61_004524 [Mycteria americana]|uniref:CCHC-type domain-containing protein n=1 Tax=Mycteria americana TaxID=33587 RepID=A0AAN7NFK6_MYCAM|nr:hypothetical protein QYF61_004524 [Mycteria americana]
MAGTYREDPEKMAKVLETIMENHDPDWKDIQVVLNTLLSYEERRTVVVKSREEAERVHAQAGRLEDHFPTTNPNWDPNNQTQRLLLTEYQRLILSSVRNAIPKLKSLSKLYEVVQGKDETPSAFFEQRCDVARKWTDLDPERETDALMFVTLFMGQSNSDIRRKLQKIEGAEARSMDKLLEVAWKVYINREEEEKKRQEKTQVKKESCKAQLLAAAIAEGNRNSRKRNYGYRLNHPPMGGSMMTPFIRSGRGKPLNKDQCTFCKQKGHWKRECPQDRFRRNFSRKQENRKVEELLTLGQDSD